MRTWIDRLFSMRGHIGRVEYVLLAATLFLCKVIVDMSVAWLVFGRVWSPAYYFSHEQVELLLRSDSINRQFYSLMMLVSVPFVWAGVALSIKRLRAAGLPVWLVFLFFLPLLKWLMFVSLGVLPSRQVRDTADTHAATEAPNATARKPPGLFASMLATALLGVALTAFNIYGIGVYGLGVFVGLPFSMGMMATVIHGREEPSLKTCLGLGIGAVTLTAAGMAIIALEGAMCLVMAAPIWAFAAGLGAAVGCIVVNSTDRRDAAILTISLVLAMPILMGAERLTRKPPPRFAVCTSVVVAAPPEVVWQHVVEFAPLDPPRELIFRAGVAYPTHATIEGRGEGAVRRCVFSTGEFVEPIRVWDEPRLLRFDVTQNPAPMRELSFYNDVHPPHLDGYMQSRAGQFHLSPTANGGTLLEGTTWYENDMAPAPYWRLWSDYLIHRIHLRVLEHVKDQAERGR